MGIFSRNNKPVNTENRDNEKQEYTVPVGLDFLTSILGKGEATAVSAFFSGVQLISSTIASVPIHVRNVKSGEIIYSSVDSAFENSILSKFFKFYKLRICKFSSRYFFDRFIIIHICNSFSSFIFR